MLAAKAPVKPRAPVSHAQPTPAAAAVQPAPAATPINPLWTRMSLAGAGACADAGDRSARAAYFGVSRRVADVRPLLARGEVRAKLTVSQPGDALEREADRVADAVMGSRGVAAVAGDTPPDQVNRACATCSAPAAPAAPACPACEEDAVVTRTANGPAARTEGFEPIASGGAPLPAAERAFFEPRFGRDLGAVRVHDSADAAASAATIDARAYTLGDHIVFGGGAYAPGTEHGRHLLAHEIAHTLQQPGAPPARVQRQVADAGAGGGPDAGRGPDAGAGSDAGPSAPALPTLTPVGVSVLANASAYPSSMGCEVTLSGGVSIPGNPRGIQGMYFGGSVAVPPNVDGNLYYVQLVRPERRRYYCVGNSEVGEAITPVWSVDTIWPYRPGLAVHGGSSGMTIPAGFGVTDSPGLRNISDTGRNYTRVCINDEFVTYLVFENAGGAFFPVASYHWRFQTAGIRGPGTCPPTFRSANCAGWAFTGGGTADAPNTTPGTHDPAQALRRISAITGADLDLMWAPTRNMDCPRVSPPRSAATPDQQVSRKATSPDAPRAPEIRERPEARGVVMLQQLQPRLPPPGTQQSTGACTTPAQIGNRSLLCCTTSMLNELFAARTAAATRVGTALGRLGTAAATGPLQAHFQVSPSNTQRVGQIRSQLTDLQRALTSGNVLFGCRERDSVPPCRRGVNASTSNNMGGNGISFFCGNYVMAQLYPTSQIFLDPQIMHRDPVHTMIHEFVHIAGRGNILGADGGGGPQEISYSGTFPGGVNPLDNADCYAHLVDALQ